MPQTLHTHIHSAAFWVFLALNLCSVLMSDISYLLFRALLHLPFVLLSQGLQFVLFYPRSHSDPSYLQPQTQHCFSSHFHCSYLKLVSSGSLRTLQDHGTPPQVSPSFIPLFLIKLVWLTRLGLQAPEVADLLQLFPHSPLGPWFPGEPGNPFSPQGPGSPGEPLSPGNNSNCLVAFSPFVPARSNIQYYIQYMCHHAGVCFCVLPFCPGQPWGPGTPHPPGGPLFPFIPQNTNEEQLY